MVVGKGYPKKGVELGMKVGDGNCVARVPMGFDTSRAMLEHRNRIEK